MGEFELRMVELCGSEMEARVRSIVRQVLSENVLDDLTTHLVRERVQQRLSAPIAQYKPQISEEINNFLLSVAPLAAPSTERHHRQAISAPSPVVALPGFTTVPTVASLTRSCLHAHPEVASLDF